MISVVSSDVSHKEHSGLGPTGSELRAFNIRERNLDFRKQPQCQRRVSVRQNDRLTNEKEEGFSSEQAHFSCLKISIKTNELNNNGTFMFPCEQETCFQISPSQSHSYNINYPIFINITAA